MSSIPSSFSRVPTFFTSQATLARLTNTNLETLRLQQQMATAKRVNRPSDDAIASATISVLDRTLARDAQQTRNADQAVATLNTIDNAIGELSGTLNDARRIASEQVGVTSDSETRALQANVVDAYIDQLFSVANRQYADMSLFAGSKTTRQAVEAFGTGYRYNGDDAGIHLDIGPEIDFPITTTADLPLGAVSGQRPSNIDISPIVTDNTRLADLRGPMVGQQLGQLDMVINGGTNASVDLTDAETLGDVRTRIEKAIRDADPTFFNPAAFGAGVTLTGTRFSFNITTPGNSVSFSNSTLGQTATALGLDTIPVFNDTIATSVSASANLNPRITNASTITELTEAPGIVTGQQISITNGPNTATLTLDDNWSVDQLKHEVQNLNLGVRVEIDDSGDRLNFVNEVAGYKMSITNVGPDQAATALGVRTIDTTTQLSEFNEGRGVEVADGDPLPANNVDFRITLSDGATTFDVDLPVGMTTVQDVIDQINAAAVAAGQGANFTAQLSTTTNGIELVDTLAGGNPIAVTSLHGYAAEDLGLLDPAVTAAGQLVASDRSMVRVDSVFSTMIELRDALQSDDIRGINFAGTRFEDDLDRLVSARALVGGRTARIEDSQARTVDRMTLNTTIKGDLQDLDFFEATTRFTALETQLQATISATARLSQLNLINFI